MRGEVAAPSRRVRGKARCSLQTMHKPDGFSLSENLTPKLWRQEPLTPTLSPQERGEGAHRPRVGYNPSFFLRWPSVRSRKALSLMKPAASRWS
jgi:hypothetical protein